MEDEEEMKGGLGVWRSFINPLGKKVPGWAASFRLFFSTERAKLEEFVYSSSNSFVRWLRALYRIEETKFRPGGKRRNFERSTYRSNSRFQRIDENSRIVFIVNSFSINTVYENKWFFSSTFFGVSSVARKSRSIPKYSIRKKREGKNFEETRLILRKRNFQLGGIRSGGEKFAARPGLKRREDWPNRGKERGPIASDSRPRSRR